MTTPSNQSRAVNAAAAAARAQQPSAPAVHAARMILRNFRLESLGRIPVSERNLAIIIDVCTQTHRTKPVIAKLINGTPWAGIMCQWADKAEFNRHSELLRHSIRELELAHNRMPNYSEEFTILGPDGHKVK